DFAGHSEQLFLRGRLLLARESGCVCELRCGEGARQKNQAQGEVATPEVAMFSHVRLQLLLFSVLNVSSMLYVARRCCNALARLRYPRKNGTMARAGRYI